jgi:hypothetical protein
MTPHDSLLFWRTLGGSLLLLGLVTGLVVATDEAYSTLGMRVARLCAFCPLIAAVAMASCLGLATRRGELRALSVLGASPWTAAFGALCAAWLFGAVAALILLTPLADVSSLFPAPPISSGWHWQGDAFVEPVRGIRVEADGAISFITQQDPTKSALVPGGLEALSAILPQALVLPPWLAAPLAPRARVFGLLLSLALTLLALHAVALGQLPRLLLPLVAAPLGAQLALSLERGQRQVTLFRTMLGRIPRKR